MADAVLPNGADVPLGVFQETAWLLSGRYGRSRSVVADTLKDILDLPNVSVEEAETVQRTIDRYRLGGDIGRQSAYCRFDPG